MVETAGCSILGERRRSFDNEISDEPDEEVDRGLSHRSLRPDIGVWDDDGEDVLVKKSRGQPDFAVEIVSTTVEHVRINLDRE